MSPATAPQDFRKTNQVFEDEVVGKGDFDALARVYTKDATVMPPDGGIITGMENIKAFWKGAAEARGATAVPLTSVSIQIVGDTAYEIGRAVIHRKDAPAINVKYVVVWKQEDGVWKWHVDIWNAAA
jgi:ketosteroid isomerase-like protein